MSRLLEPMQIKSLYLKNRLVMPPMATGKADSDGRVSEELLAYYEEKSHGGFIGLIITEHSFVSPEGKASNNQMSAADDEMVRSMSKLAKCIQQNGSKAVAQINHAGSAAYPEIIGTMPVGPSAIVHPRRENILPHMLSREEIAGIAESFQNAARRVKEAGFDGVEIHSAHGYLLNQFYSPLTNIRTDEYGGSVLDRIRIHMEVIQAVRGEVGKDFPIFLRLGASDYTEGGTRIEDSFVAAGELEKAGVDVLDVSGGFCGYVIPGMAGEQGYFSSLTEALKKEVSIPVILTGGITEAKAAERLLEEKKAELVGVGRAILSNSHWAKQAVESLDI